MILKMYEVINFPSFYEKVKSQKLPFKTSYHLTLLAQEIEKHTVFYQEQFRELLNTYGQKNEDGTFVMTDDGQGVRLVEETMNEAYEKIAELRQLDVELPDVKLDIDQFNNVEMSSEEMVTFMPFFRA